MNGTVIPAPPKSLIDRSNGEALQSEEHAMNEMMVSFLLDNLQPYLWTKKKEAIMLFEEFVFTQYPVFSTQQTQDILIGRGGKGRGLMETAGGTSWKKHGRLRKSSAKAVGLIVRLLDPTQHPGECGCSLSFSFCFTLSLSPFHSIALSPSHPLTLPPSLSLPSPHLHPQQRPKKCWM